MLADAYASARLAELTIEIQTTDGTRLAGVPAFGDDEVWPADDNIDSAELSIDGQAVALKSIVAFVVHTARPEIATRWRSRPETAWRGRSRCKPSN